MKNLLPARPSTGAAMLCTAVALSACTPTIPTEPMIVMVPPPEKTQQLYTSDHETCRLYAFDVTRGSEEFRTATPSAVMTAGLLTLLGAGAGAALGSTIGAVGSGAAVGATYGALAGSAVGAGRAGDAQARIAFMFNASYERCMVMRGYRR